MASKKRAKRIKKTTLPKAVAEQTVITTLVPSKASKAPVKNVIATLSNMKNSTLAKIDAVSSSDQSDKIVASLSALVLLVGVLWLSFSYIPYLYKFTELGKNEDLVSKTQERTQQKALENARIAPINGAVLKTSVGDLKLNLYKAQAPVTVDNFLRLADRSKYTNVPFHRLVKQNGFHVIQTGDYEFGNGKGGVGADSKTIQDELWRVFPEYNEEGNLINQPQFNVPDAYSNFVSFGKDQQGITQTQVIIKKGMVAMAKTQDPNSASSQFFIVLEDTTLPADYSVFARVNDSSVEVMNTLISLNQADTAQNSGSKPDRDVTLLSVSLEK